jgi:DNA-binding IclR family transcriptional regulator
MLANMPADRAEAILDAKGLERFTEETVTDRERLTDELETIRDEGVAFNYGEYIEGMHTVSVPVFDDNDRIAGALGVSGPAHRLKGDRLHEEIPDLLLGTANELEINISYQ